MPTTYTYKRQGDGRDSWIVTETDSGGNTINRYIVYEDPNKTSTRKAFESLPEADLSSIRSIIGTAGAQGTAGSNGSNGSNGAQGTQGRQGVAGSNGSNGTQGATGATGVGATGATGPQGPQGIQGPAGSGGSGGGGIASVKTLSQAFIASVDETGIAFVGPKGLTTDVRVSDGKSLITLSFIDGILFRIT